MFIAYAPPFTSKIEYEVLPNDKGTKVSIIFDTDQVSKPPVLQRRQALMLLSILKEISAPFIMENFDIELLELTPVREEDRKEYDDIKDPDSWSFSTKPKIISSDTVEKIGRTFFKVHSGKFICSGKDALEYENLIILRTILKWYCRSLEYRGLLDKFISLWVNFNMIYDYLWKRNHPNEKLPSHSKRISDCIYRTLNNDECKEVFEPYKFILPEQMPPYELIETKDEIEMLLKSKDIKKIEANHKKFLDKEKQDLGFNTRDYLGNKYGLDFGKYWLVEDWVNSLTQVLLHIYGTRNLVFHGGVIPMEEMEGIIDDPDSYLYWSMLNKILIKVNGLIICKILELNRSSTNSVNVT